MSFKHLVSTSGRHSIQQEKRNETDPTTHQKLTTNKLKEASVDTPQTQSYP
jgi:hypothetical protein